jgi:hypothetical protein
VDLDDEPQQEVRSAMESVDFLLGNVDKEGQLEDDEVLFVSLRLTNRTSGRFWMRETAMFFGITSPAASTSAS